MKTESNSVQGSASYNIDRSQVTLPTLTFTEIARDQLNLMLENDFTLQGST